MALDGLAVSLHRIAPYADGFIVGSRGDDLAVWRDTYIINWALMANESIRPERWFEVPDHERAIK